MADKRGILPVLFLLACILGPLFPAEAKPPVEVAVRRQEERNRFIKFETVVSALGIGEGMTILDIGSGPGYASFLLARALHGTGKVFATDIRDDFARYIAEQARKKDLRNLFPVVVKESGFDDFYRTQRYDIVLASNVYHVLRDRIAYFRELRSYLKPGARLVLILYNQTPLFSEDDFTDLQGITSLLSRAGGDDPFFRHLSADTRELLPGRGKTDKLKGSLAEDFNRMLTDPHFYEEFYDGSYLRKDLFTAPERAFANWLLMSLAEKGSLDKAVGQLNDKDLRDVIQLNRLFFQSRFGAYLANGGMGAYIPAGDANRHVSKYVVFRELAAAGYVPAREIRLSPYFDAEIMVPSAP